jgi:hypothetical protein
MQATDHCCLYRVANNADVRIMLLVGEIMPRVFRGETTMLEHFRTSGLLDEYYAQGFGTMQSAQWLGGVVKQITDRHPHLRLLEIGKSTQPPHAPWWMTRSDDGGQVLVPVVPPNLFFLLSVTILTITRSPTFHPVSLKKLPRLSCRGEIASSSKPATPRKTL